MISSLTSATGHRRDAMRAGFSMTELVIVISVIGVISGLAVSNYGNLLKSSKETVALDRVEMLNRSLSSFAVENFEQRLNRIDSSTGDELAVPVLLVTD